MVVPQVPSRVGRLHNHLLALQRRARESELVAGTAPRGLVAPRNVDGGPAVGEGVADGPGALVGAHEGAAAAVAAGLGVAAVVERAVVLVARLDGAGRRALARPGARRLAAVPVARGLARGLREGHGGEDGQEGGGLEMHDAGWYALVAVVERGGTGRDRGCWLTSNDNSITRSNPDQEQTPTQIYIQLGSR